MPWDYFVYFSVFALILWYMGTFMAFRNRHKLSLALTVSGLAVFFFYILWMWLNLHRPPMRTLGETRLWYAFALPMVGLFVYSKWRYKWILLFSAVMSTVFVTINLLKPEIHTRTLMPALQSPFFAPHVIVYMFAYAMLGAAALVALYCLFLKRDGAEASQVEMNLCDSLVSLGTAFLTIGMLLGALWAKEAWGHYWTWDPKETWAAITWFIFLIYIHWRRSRPKETRVALWIIVIGFVMLQICWWGINYLPSAKGSSEHVY